MSLLNKAINKLPIELHIPGYKFCGPGTKLTERIARGDIPKNQLDQACREHDLSYNKSESLDDRHKADEILKQKAWLRVKSKDASVGERLAALGVAGVMKGKLSLGMGNRRRKHNFKAFANSIQRELKKLKVNNTQGVIGAALNIAKKLYKRKKGKIPIPRVISLKKGGFLPLLIPIFAALSALGAVGGAAANIASAVNKAKEGQKNFEEAQRHNKSMEAIAIGKGVFLGPYRKGCGIYLAPYKGCGRKN